MRHLSYFCRSHLTPQELQTMNHVTALHRKILAGRETISDLNESHFMTRDHLRINRILQAIRKWEEELNQIFEKDIE